MAYNMTQAAKLCHYHLTPSHQAVTQSSSDADARFFADTDPMQGLLIAVGHHDHRM